jgi:hypothetical protein
MQHQPGPPAAPASGDYTPCPEDFGALQQEILRRRPWARFAAAAAGSALVGLTTLLYARGFNPTASWRFTTLVAVLLALFTFAVGWFLPFLGQRWAGWIAYRSMAMQTKLVPQCFELAPEGLRALSAQGETLTRWDAIESIVTRAGYSFFFIGPGRAFVVPMRAFSSQHAFAAFVAEAERLWAPHKLDSKAAQDRSSP